MSRRFDPRSGAFLRGHPDSAADITERRRARAAGEQAHAEAMAKFGTVTPENALDFVTWQQARFDQLTRSRPDSTADIIARHRRAGALAQVKAELAVRFPTITVDNADEVLAWQEARAKELIG